LIFRYNHYYYYHYFIFQDYAPEIILVSAGFDAASGHPAPLGGYNVTPACFAYMTQQLMQIADGKVCLFIFDSLKLISQYFLFLNNILRR